MEPLVTRSNDPGIFVPAFPTIRPESFLRVRGRGIESFHPFSAPSARYFYFARNAIWHAVRTLGLDRGEILVPAYHHGVEIEALVDAGATPRFYSVGPRFEIDLDEVEAMITARTRALYLTHFLGFPGPVRRMKALAHRHGLPLVEDCALALFSADDDSPLGLTGDIAVFCLYKVLPVPDGGVLVRNDPNVLPTGVWPEAEGRDTPSLASGLSVLASSMLRNVALRGGRPGRAFRGLLLGAGKRALRASNVQPVLAGTQHFDRNHADLGPSRATRLLLRTQDVREIVRVRRRNYEFLLDRLRPISKPLFETLPAGVVPLCYPLIVDDNKSVAEALVARGIEGVDLWREGHPSCDASAFPAVARLRTSIVEIPCYQDIDLHTLEHMVAVIRDVLATSRSRVIPAAA
jgi:perosamine synthetase